MLDSLVRPKAWSPAGLVNSPSENRRRVREVIEQMGTTYLLHPANRVKRITPVDHNTKTPTEHH